MSKTSPKMVLTALFMLTYYMAKVQAACPWDDPTLEKWSDPLTWGEGGIPQENKHITIPAGRKIILDVPIPRLRTLTVQGTLVWGDVEGLRLETSYLAVKGEFHMGSEDCPLDKTADIFLYGKYDDGAYYDSSLGTKFIAAFGGARVEIHGKPKMSWTKLVETVGPSDVSCGDVYDSLTEKFGDEYQYGMQVVVWNPDGTVYDYGVSDTRDSQGRKNFVYKIGNITETGKIVAVAVHRDIGSPGSSWENVYQAVESLGGKLIRNVRTHDPYVLLAVTGQNETAIEDHVSRSDNSSLKAYVTYNLDSRNLVFSAESVTRPYSSKYDTRYRVRVTDLAFPLVNVLDDISTWQTGDQVVVASTDFDWRQAEVKTLVNCTECTAYQFRVDEPFTNEHFGRITYGVDARAEVGLLSRNIRIEGEVQPECYAAADDTLDNFLCTRFETDTFGGHVIALRNSIIHVEGAELYHMGQQRAVGKYPLHFHMADEAPGQYFKSNSIHDSFSRCITIHGTDNTTVSDNVCYKHLGHGIFLEDSAERWNTIHRNLVIGTSHGFLIPSDKKRDECDGFDYCSLLSSFWITRPENFVTDNVAAGSDSHGIVLAFADWALGQSYARQLERNLLTNLSAQYTPMALFDGNVMHSNEDSGLWYDSRISAGQYHNGVFVPPDGVIRTNSLYDPRSPPTVEGERTDSICSRLTFYKNDDFDAWLRCGNIVITNSTFADSPTSYTGTHTTLGTTCSVRNSIFIGRTENKGAGFTYINESSVYDGLPDSNKPQHKFDRSITDNNPNEVQIGMVMYQGPMYVENVYFDRYFNDYFNDSFINEFGFRPVRCSSAIGFHQGNDYALIPRSGVKNLKWGFCDGENNAWRVQNGNESFAEWKFGTETTTTTFHDYDGSLTGTANTHIVQTRPFYLGPECLNKPEWDMSICSSKYTQIRIRGTGGVLSSPYDSQYPLIFSRDDAREDAIHTKGHTGLKYVARVNKSYTIRYNNSLTFINAPSEVIVKAQFGLEADDVVRFAVCFPRDARTFEISGKSPLINSQNPPIWVNSLAELDADTTMKAVFWDSSKGYIYFKLQSNNNFNDPRQTYAEDIPIELTVTRLDGDDIAEDCPNDNPPYENPNAPQLVPVSETPCTGTDSAEGLGAPLRFNDQQVTPVDICANPPQPDVVVPDRPAEPRGCFSEEYYLDDYVESRIETVELRRSMTPEFCISRCFQRNCPFAALISGSKCQCADSIGRNGALSSETNCLSQCTGDSSRNCGGGSREAFIYTSGAALTQALARCGPQGRGAVFEDKCMYANYVLEPFESAETRCVLLGGRLASIEGPEKQAAIAVYLQDIEKDVWFGVYGDATNWYDLDGSVITWFNWRDSPYTPADHRNLFLKEYRRYKWEKSPHYRLKMSLCDLPIETTTVTGQGDCGVDLQGTKSVTTGRCLYRVPMDLTYKEAGYECMRNAGRMASILDSSERADVEEYLLNNLDGERYWVVGNPVTQDYQMAYDESSKRDLIELREDKLYRALCVLDSQDTNGCPGGWLSSNSACYLDTGATATSYFQAAGICNSKRTSVLSINNQAESDYLGTVVSGIVWTDLRYDGVRDTILTSAGIEPSAMTSFWATPNPLQNLSNGMCVTFDLATKTLHQVRCRNTTARKVVCEAPLTYWSN